jgi:hypothetical protein
MPNPRKRLADLSEQKQTFLPEKYVLLIKTPKKALAVEGRKDFTEHSSRDASTVVWFELLYKLSQLKGLETVNRKYRLTHYSPLLAVPEGFSGMTITHEQDGTITFGGRFFANCAYSSEDTTLELFAYFDEALQVPDDEVRTVMQEFCVGMHDL